jgi:hypothetical protein
VNAHAVGIDEDAVGSPGLTRAIVERPKHRLGHVGEVGRDPVASTVPTLAVACRLTGVDLTIAGGQPDPLFFSTIVYADSSKILRLDTSGTKIRHICFHCMVAAVRGYDYVRCFQRILSQDGAPPGGSLLHCVARVARTPGKTLDGGPSRTSLTTATMSALIVERQVRKLRSPITLMDYQHQHELAIAVATIRANSR